MRTNSALTHGDHYYILKNHQFLEGTLKGDQLRRFKQMIDKIATSIDYHCDPKKGGSGVGARLREMLAVLDDCGGEEGLSKTFKKLALIHIFIQQAGSSGSLGEELSKAVFEELERVQKREFRALTKEKGGVMGELRQIFKDLTNKHNMPQCLQKQSSKTVLKEIVDKIYRPFRMYLLRIVQDGDIYSFLMQKTADLPQCHLWKVINLCKQLGSLITQLNRIVRYFRQDFSGIYCHFIYLISIDINQFYDLLRSEASQKCSKWRSTVQELQSLKHKDHLAYQLAKEALLKDPEFIQTKRLIEELAAIREDLIWIYMNKELRVCLKHFKRPARGIQIEIDPETNHIINLQKFIEREASSPLQHHKNKRKTSIELEQNVCLLLKQIEQTEISTGASIGEGQFEDHHTQQSQ